MVTIKTDLADWSLESSGVSLVLAALSFIVSHVSFFVGVILPLLDVRPLPYGSLRVY